MWEWGGKSRPQKQQLTVRILKVQTPKKIAVIILKLKQFHFTTE